MGFNNTIALRAECPEYIASLTQKPISGAWTATIKYKGGTVETYTFINETAMRRELESRSKHKVRFIREVLDATQTSASVEAARQRMLETAPRKVDPKTAQQSREQSVLERAGYSKEESDAIIWGCYSAAAQLRDWFLDSDDNLDTVSRYLTNNRMPPTAENFGKAMDYLYSNNHLVRKSRKRGDPVISQYIGHPQMHEVNKRREAESLSLEELRQIERRRQAEARKRLRLDPNHIF